MIIAGYYSFNGGEAVIQKKYPHLLQEIEDSILSIDADIHKTKQSEEKTMVGKILFSPSSLNNGFKSFLYPLDWNPYKVVCDYSNSYYINGYNPPRLRRGQQPYREMDFVKEKLGVEVQFGKYSFMVYNVCAKMTIFKNLGIIDAGIEIVPVKAFANEMSTGVSYFEQFTWDLEHRGVADIDVPVLIIGIDA